MSTRKKILTIMVYLKLKDVMFHDSAHLVIPRVAIRYLRTFAGEDGFGEEFRPNAEKLP